MKKWFPYKRGFTKTFWAFTSVSLSKEIEYGPKKDKNSSEKNTLFIIDGYRHGYDITLFNYSGKEIYLLEPEQSYTINNILYPSNDIVSVSCVINCSFFHFENFKKEGQKQERNEMCFEDESIYDIYFPKIKKYLLKMKVKLKEEETIISTGVLCNIPQKKIKALITYNHTIDFNILVNKKILKITINDIDKEINLKINRFKYTNKELDITIIEILDEDNINDFIEIDESIGTKEYINERIISIGFKNEEEEDIENTKIWSIRWCNSFRRRLF